MVNYLLVFILLFVLDLAWSCYLNSVKDSNPLRSGGWAAFLYVLGASATISWVNNPCMLVPACLGAFMGTYVGVWWNKRKK